jgi:anthranilate phosphoribosyltransferase
MDELTVAGTNHVAGIGRYAELDGKWSAEHFGFDAAPPTSVIGGSAEENFAAFQDILAGQGVSGLVDTLVLNAGIALHLVEAVESPAAGFEEARNALSDGRVKAWLERARRFFEQLP